MASTYRRDWLPAAAPTVTRLKDERLVVWQEPRSGRGWINGLLAIATAFLGLLCAMEGDRAQPYNGWLVAFGWALILIGWRVFVDRRQPLRSPLAYLWDGIRAASFLITSFVVRFFMILLGLGLLIGVLALAEAVVNRF